MAESEASWLDDKEIASSPTGTSPAALHEPQWTDGVVPPGHKNRTLIVCFDGTGDKFDADVGPPQHSVVPFLELITDYCRIPTSFNSSRC